MKKAIIFLLIVLTLIYVGHKFLKKTKDSEKEKIEKSIEKKVEILDNKKLTDSLKLYQEKKFNEAIESLKNDIKNNKGEKDRNIAHIAKSYEYIGQKENSVKEWQKLLTEFPNSQYAAEGKYFIAQLYKKGSEDYYKWLEEASKDYNSEAGKKAAIELANKYESENDIVKSWQMLSRALRTNLPCEERRGIRTKLDEIVKKALFSNDVKIPGCTYYKTVSGDSFYKIARNQKTSIGLIKRLNGRTSNTIRVGEELKILTGDIFIEVSKKCYFLTIFLPNGLYLESYDVGLGKNNKTPVANFVIKTRLENPAWKGIPFGDPRNPLGTRWLGFENKPGLEGFGIHGTKEPSSIGKDMSDGCVRMRNEEVEKIFDIIPRGTKVIIKAD